MKSLSIVKKLTVRLGVACMIALILAPPLAEAGGRRSAPGHRYDGHHGYHPRRGGHFRPYGPPPGHRPPPPGFHRPRGPVVHYYNGPYHRHDYFWTRAAAVTALAATTAAIVNATAPRERVVEVVPVCGPVTIDGVTYRRCGTGLYHPPSYLDMGETYYYED